MKLRLLLSAALPLLALQQSQAARLYVKAGATGAHTGASWATAYDQLQPALTAAVSGDSIFVAAGTYLPTTIAGGGSDPRDRTFLLKSGVRLYGGFAGTEAGVADRDTNKILGANSSILSGNIGLPDPSDNVYHVVMAVDAVVLTRLDGFVISHGNANGLGVQMIGGKNIPRNFGGGIYTENSNTLLRTVRVSENRALTGGAGINNEHSRTCKLQKSFVHNNRIDGTDPGTGGGAGMRNSQDSDVDIITTEFNNNEAHNTQGGGALRNEHSYVSVQQTKFLANLVDNGDGGGAVYNADSSDSYYDNVSFTSNTTNQQGGGMYNDNSRPELSNVTFTNNSGDKGGAAMENDGGSHASLVDVTFTGNNTPANGGAIQNWKSSPVLYLCKFLANKSGADGGAIYNYNDCSPKITACTFRENYALNNGGAIYNKRNSNPVITSSLIILNKANNDGGGIYNTANTSAGSLPCSPVLTNVTLTRNEAGNSGGGGFDDGFGNPLLRNSIVSDNIAAAGLPDIDAPISLIATALSHTILTDQYFETGLSTPVPIVPSTIFLDPLLKDFRLAPGSPAIDMGDSNVYKATAIPDIHEFFYDIRWANRSMGLTVDLGAYETCSDTTKPGIIFSVSPDTAVAPGTTVTFDATIFGSAIGATYIWMKNGVPVATGKTYIAVAGTDFMSGDKISVKGISGDVGNPCTIVDTAYSISRTMLITMGLDGVTSSAGMRIAPNPNNGDFMLEPGLIKNNNYQVSILDITGRELYRENFVAGNTLQALNLGGKLQTGTYFLTVSVSDVYRKTIQFIVK